jgi:hypothetical protein
MKDRLQMGLFVDGKMIMHIGASQENSQPMMLFMDSLAGHMDDVYQKIKVRDGVDDNSYIAFDFCKGVTKQ